MVALSPAVTPPANGSGACPRAGWKADMQAGRGQDQWVQRQARAWQQCHCNTAHPHSIWYLSKKLLRSLVSLTVRKFHLFKASFI